MTFNDYYKRIYASWLGKLIGIRLGAPIENWLGIDVRRMYHPIKNYTVDYGQFAADDDANGPLFFVSVMEKYNLDTISMKAMGEHLLNVVGDHTGFFWWGGNGIATEETAWSNLMKGMSAPDSGSKETNGKTIANQIGGQIFSDCWGYITLGDVTEAVRLAKMMSHVTHDEEGVEGAIFVSACIALAWNKHDIKEIIDEAKEYLTPSSKYYALVNEIEEIHEKHPDDSDYCLNYIEKNHSYDCYDGVCHILPNAAIMLYGMLYGHNDFNETMRLIAEAGRDTDCNLGNVGSIMGMMLGLEGIDEKWITPFNDILLSSSSIGSKNITTISASAKYFTELGCKLYGIPYEEHDKNLITYDFSLPYATNGFTVVTNRYSAVSVRASHGLQINLDHVLKGEKVRIYKKTYFTSDEVYDCRYQPQYTPVLEEGDIIHLKLRTDDDIELVARLIYINDEGEQFAQDIEMSKDETIQIQKMRKSPIITSIVIELKPVNDLQRNVIYLDYFNIEKHPHFEYKAKDLKVEDWGLNFDGNHEKGIRGLDIYRGKAYLTSDELILKDHSAFNVSSVYAKFKKIELELEVNDKSNFTLAFDWNGTFDYRGFIFDLDKQELKFICRKSHSDAYVRHEGEITFSEKIKIIIDFAENEFDVEYNNMVESYLLSDDVISEYGAIALINEGESDLVITSIKGEAE